MADVPRIVTVDPTGEVGRVTRSAIDLLDLSVIHIDVPGSTQALEELNKANLVIASYVLDDAMKGFEFAIQARRAAPSASVLILGEEGDPEEFDEATTQESPFVYLVRPVEPQKLVRVLLGGLESEETMKAALTPPQVGGGADPLSELGDAPTLDLKQARRVVDQLLQDLGSMAIILSSRTNETLIEVGAPGIKPEELTRAVVPMMLANIKIRDLVGGQVATTQLYDGDRYDVFVLSVGLHHFLSVIFDGQSGSRQFGIVTRFGRRAVEDLIALLGANAFFIQPRQTSREDEPASAPKRSHKPTRKEPEAEEVVELAQAEILFEEAPQTETAAPVLAPIDESSFDVDALFGQDFGAGEDLFDLDKLEDVARSNVQSGKTFDWDEAISKGVLKN